MLRVFCGAALVSGCAAWTAGFGQRNVDPSPAELRTNGIFLGGYGALGFRGPANGVNDPIEAQAFYISSGGQQYAHVVIDVVGMGNRLSAQIRQQTSQRTGIPENNIMVGSTHTHCGPDFQGIWAGVTPTYRQFVVDGAVNALVEAFTTAVDAELRVSTVSPGNDINRNRRGWGWVINTTSTLDVLARSNGRRIGTVINFAAHPVTLGANVLQASGDYIGYARQAMRALTGAQVVFVTGPIGDVSPGPSTGTGFERSRTFGVRVADLCWSSMQAGQRTVSEGLVVRTDRYPQVVTNSVFLLAWFAGILAPYYNMEELPGGIGITTSVNYIKLGQEAEAVTFPGESLTRNAEVIQNSMASVNFFFGLTQDSLGYLVPTDEWQTGRNGNYEEGVSMDRLAGDGARDRLLALMRMSTEERAAVEVRATNVTGAGSAAKKRIMEILGKERLSDMTVLELLYKLRDGSIQAEDW